MEEQGQWKNVTGIHAFLSGIVANERRQREQSIKKYSVYQKSGFIACPSQKLNPAQ